MVAEPGFVPAGLRADRPHMLMHLSCPSPQTLSQEEEDETRMLQNCILLLMLCLDPLLTLGGCPSVSVRQ